MSREARENKYDGVTARLIYWADTGGNDAWGWECRHFHRSGPRYETRESAQEAADKHLAEKHGLPLVTVGNG